MKSRGWRNKTKQMLNTRPIYEHEFPALAKAMAEDGLTLRIVSKGNGYEWLVADYILSAKSVREVKKLGSGISGPYKAYEYAVFGDGEAQV